MSLNVELIESSFRLLAPRAGQLTDIFYGKLFTTAPGLRPLFPEDMTRQKESLIATLVVIVQSLRKPNDLRETVQDLAIRHIDYGAERAHYPVVGQLLVESMQELAGDAWTDEMTTNWVAAYGAIQGMVYETLDAHEAA